jgi:hypothetical protein
VSGRSVPGATWPWAGVFSGEHLNQRYHGVIAHRGGFALSNGTHTPCACAA